MSGKAITLQATARNTIENVKNKIQDQEEIPPKLQRLRFNGVSLVECITLGDYNIQAGSVLNLVILEGALRIFVKTVGGKTITLGAEETNTIQDLKSKIQIKTDIPFEQQIIRYQGQQLKDGRFLSEYNIQDDSTLHVAALEQDNSESTFEIIVKTPNKKSHYTATNQQVKYNSQH